MASEGNPTKQLIAFHRERSGCGVGIAFVGSTAVSQEYAYAERALVLDGHSRLADFAELSNAILLKGSLPGIQLNAALPNIKPNRQWKSADRPQTLSRLRDLIGRMPVATLARALQKFVAAATLAIRAGFRVVEIHAAHGYLISLLLWEETNPRTDEFGLPEPALPFQLLRRLRDIDNEVVLSVRLNVCHEDLPIDPYEEDLDRCVSVAKLLATKGCDLISLSAGVYDLDKSLIYPDGTAGEACYFAPAARVAGQVSSCVGVAGNVRDLARVAEILPDNMIVGLACPLIADPDFVKKWLDGKHDQIAGCTRCGHCHFYTRGIASLECPVSPDLLPA